MTPEREDEIRGAAETLQWARDGDAADMMLDLLAALDAARAREARLREAAAEVVRQVLGDDPSWWTPERRPDAATMVTTKTLGLYDALAADAATTWLAGRERAAAVRALRWAAHISWLQMRKHADAIEAGTEEVP